MQRKYNFITLSLFILSFLITQIVFHYTESIYTGYYLEDYIHSKGKGISTGIEDFKVHHPYLRDDINKSDDSIQTRISDDTSYKIIPQEISQIDVIYVKTNMKYDQIFGHIFFRLRFCNHSKPCKSEYNDLAFDITIGNYSSPDFSEIKSLGFSYKAYLEAHKFKHLRDRYLEDGRSLISFHLDLESEDTHKLVSYLLKNNRSILGTWNSLYFNCNYYLQKILITNIKPLQNYRPFYSIWGTSFIETYEILLEKLNVYEITMSRP